MKIILYIIPLLAMLSCGHYDKGRDDWNASKWAAPVPAKFYKGTTMTFAPFLMKNAGAVYTENGEEKDPYQTLKDHGANMVRLEINVDNMEVTSEPVEYIIDTKDWEIIKPEIETCKRLGIDVLLTIFLSGEESEAIPLSWKAISPTTEELGQMIYDYVYEKLDYLASHDMMPAIVAIGNETNSTFCWDDALYGDENKMEHGVKCLNKGYEAVDAINAKYGTKALKLVHFHNPQHVEWCMTEWVDKRKLSNFDVVGLSWYYGMHEMGIWSNFEEMSRFLWLRYRKQFMIIETSAPFTLENGDQYGNTGPSSTPGYDYTPEGQKRYFEDLAQDVANGYGLGVICWGGEWVGGDVWLYPGFKGSSWDNQAFWRSTYGDNIHEVHEGIDWMKQEYKPIR